MKAKTVLYVVGVLLAVLLIFRISSKDIKHNHLTKEQDGGDLQQVLVEPGYGHERYLGECYSREYVVIDTMSVNPSEMLIFYIPASEFFMAPAYLFSGHRSPQGVIQFVNIFRVARSGKILPRNVFTARSNSFTSVVSGWGGVTRFIQPSAQFLELQQLVRQSKMYQKSKTAYLSSNEITGLP